MGERFRPLQRPHLLLLSSAEEHRRLVRRDLVPGQPLENVAAQFGRVARAPGTVLTVVAEWCAVSQAKRPHERLDPRPHRRVRHLQLALELLGVPAGPQEALQQGQLLAAEPAETADVEVALDRREKWFSYYRRAPDK